MSKTSQNPRREHSETTGPAQYFLVTKRGTKLETFKSFVETLPDGGRGYQMASRGLGDQSYITTLTYEEAKEIARKPFIEYVVLAATPLGTVPNIIPGPKPSRESIAMSDTSNESDCEDSGTKEPVEYLITTKEGTKLSTFERFIKTLPDRGEGHLMVFELLQEQSYVTKLTYERAMEVAKEPFVDYVILAGAVEKTDPMISGAPIPEQSTNSCNTSDQGFGRRLTAGQHLRILSHPRQSEEEKNQGPWAAYKYDPVLGKGQTIYIIDSGFNTGHEEMLGDRIRATITLSNRLTLSDIPDRTLWPCENDPTDYCGHGTLVASIAAGQLYGVASNANIVVVKMRQTFFHPNGSWEDITLRPVTRKALRKVWADIVEDVLRRRSQGDRGKSIVCVSSGRFAFESLA
jgi:subtilisin family serine protease